MVNDEGLQTTWIFMENGPIDPSTFELPQGLFAREWRDSIESVKIVSRSKFLL
jgi:hypothetical protein